MDQEDRSYNENGQGTAEPENNGAVGFNGYPTGNAPTDRFREPSEPAPAQPDRDGMTRLNGYPSGYTPVDPSMQQPASAPVQPSEGTVQHIGQTERFTTPGREFGSVQYPGNPGCPPPPQNERPLGAVGEHRPPMRQKFVKKSFVVTAVALGILISMLIEAGVLAVLFKQGILSVDKKNTSGGSVHVDYVTPSDKKDEDEDVDISGKGMYAKVVKKVADAVVEVRTETVSTSPFYGQYITSGAGSGVIISSDESGTCILTCAHVIENATNITVTLRNGDSYTAESKSFDTQTDIGIIKLKEYGFVKATVGDFSKVVVGEEVVAIGNPLGELGGTVTEGIISALDREIEIEGNAYKLLQTSAPINPGNSGGGLFDMNGNLIGITNGGYSGSNVQSLFFSIPVDNAMKIATELIKNGYVSGRPMLGFMLVDIQSQQDVMNYWQYSRYFTETGVYIIEANDSNFHTGDRLIAINSVTVDSTTAIPGLLEEYKPGDTVTITVSRLGTKNRTEIMNIDLVLSEKSNG